MSRSSERFFIERPYLDHVCYLYLTRKPAGRHLGSSALSSLLRKHIVPVETLDEKFFEDFIAAVGQFEQILCDSGFVSMKRLKDEELSVKLGEYLNLGSDHVVRDISFDGGIQVGEKHCELFVLADVADLPAHCGARLHYDRYSSDKARFGIGFASQVGQLLSCNHVYNQYLFIEDSLVTIKKLEARKLRLQSLSAYSRNNLLAKQSVDDFLNEANGGQQLPVKAHFNVLAWSDSREQLKSVRNLCGAALSQMDVTPKIETVGAPQIFWAGIPGNAADFPMNEAFDTFSVQASCFFNLETNYRTSVSPIGVRLGDRISGRPRHLDISDELMERGLVTNRIKYLLAHPVQGSPLQQIILSDPTTKMAPTL